MDGFLRAHVIISGRVQGVFFRIETRDAAGRIGDIRGWVRNRRDGTVEALLEGPGDRVERLLEWCRQGPPLAEVRDVAVTWQPYEGEFEGFDIIR
jgi:acylphosphatase